MAATIAEVGAVTCSICNSLADLLTSGIYVCQSNPNHMGDTFTDIFTDPYPPETTNTHNPTPTNPQED